MEKILLIIFILLTSTTIIESKDAGSESQSPMNQFIGFSSDDLTTQSLLTYPKDYLQTELLMCSNMYAMPISTFFSEPLINDPGQFLPLIGNTGQMQHFYDTLKKSDSMVVRIAHFGDSMIWGDIISSHLRELFQQKFGGKGAGFLSICSDDITIKQTTIHSFSDDIEWASLFTRNAKRFPIGIGGTVALPKEGSWVNYKAGSVSSSTKSFERVKIYYSNVPADGRINYTINNSHKGILQLSTGENLQESVIEFDQSISSIKLSFYGVGGGYFYGVSLESGNGIYVDNIPIRGNSGVSLEDIDGKILNDIKRYMNYDLIILNFGINAVQAGETRYTWYKKKMIKLIEQLKTSFPDISIILVSTGDRSIKKGNKLVSDPEIIPLINAQKEISKESQVAYWDMQAAMGGNNSMTNWVNENPPLAFKDYIHLTYDGGKIIAKLLFEAILKDYK